ncbi:MAG: diguanylate cyclase [Xanthomonadaceae bacterium]|nr:diguanylate cyclase [Xanthomonadaceae bacterium]
MAHHRLLIVVALALLSGSVFAASPAAVPPAAMPAGQAAAFDALYRRLDNTEIFTLDPAQVQQRLADLERLLPRNDNARLLHYQSMRCSWGFNDARQQLAYADDGLRRAQAVADADAQIRFLYCRGAAREQAATSVAALQDYDAAIALARRQENNHLLADGLVARGSVQSLLGEQGHAILDFLAAQGLYEREGLKDDAESNLFNLAVAYRRLGDLDKAMEYLKQSEAFAESINDHYGLSATLMQEAYWYENQGRSTEALDMYQRALAVAQKQPSPDDIAAAHLGMAFPYIQQRRFARALQMLDRAQAEFKAVGDVSNDDMIDLRRGQALAGLDRQAQALARFNRAEAGIERSGNLRYMAKLYQARAATQQALGHADAAIADLQRYIDTTETIDRTNRSQQAEVLRFQFDSARRDLENRRLLAEKSMQEHQVAALLEARRWQWTALLLGGLLLALLGSLVVRQIARTRRLHILASTDALTGVANRRHVERFGSEAIVRARDTGQPLTVVTFDIDHFKRVNDARGHLAGDQVLARLASACQDALRQFDLLGRLGGEEFMVVLPNTRLEQALPIAERLRMAVSSLNLSDIGGELAITISVGMAELKPEDADLKALLHRADRALYRAKAQGRDCIEMHA